MEPTWTRWSTERGWLFVAVILGASTPARLSGETTLSPWERDRTLAALGEASSEGSVEASPDASGSARSVTLVWYDVEGLLPSGREAVARHVAAFFGRVPLRLRWREGDPGVGAEHESFEVPVVLLGADPAPGRRPVLGATRRGGPAPRPIWVFLEPLWRTLGRKTRRAPFAPGDVGYLAQPLARVIAHELVHSLAPDHGHASSGLMKHSFTRRDLLGEASRIDLDLVRGWLEGGEVVSDADPVAKPAHN